MSCELTKIVVCICNNIPGIYLGNFTKDGHFVKNISFGYFKKKSVQTSKFLTDLPPFGGLNYVEIDYNNSIFIISLNLEHLVGTLGDM